MFWPWTPDAGRTVAEVADTHGVAWWTVQRTVNTAATVHASRALPGVRWLGIDEHRYRWVRFYRDQNGAWARYEPGGTARLRGRMSTLVDLDTWTPGHLDTGRVLGVVDGRGSAGITAWLDAAPLVWREGVQVVAIDPCAASRKAIRTRLPRAAVGVDAFHLVKLAGDMVTALRQRVIREAQGRRGTKTDLAWTNRRLLLRAGNTLSRNAMTRVQTMFATADTTGEIAAAWAIKEQLRRVLVTTSLHEADEAFDTLTGYVSLAGLPEADRLLVTLNAWWPHIEVLVITGVTNARTEAANTTIKQLKRSARGFRNPGHYRARILLHSAARTAA